MRSIFVTFEGVDGSGKSSQIRTLVALLREMGIPCAVTREPGGSAIGEAIRSILLDPANSEMTLNTEVLLYCASRAQLVHEVITPALREGKVVICERYADSTVAYQCYGGGCDIDTVKRINAFATGGLEPDLTIVLDVDPATGAARRSNRLADRIEKRTEEYYNRVREGYLAIARENPQRVKVVNASGSVEAVGGEVLRLVRSVLANSI
ncbi:MAG: dTMP kinase [Ignavibacteriales bacterium]